MRFNATFCDGWAEGKVNDLGKLRSVTGQFFLLYNGERTFYPPPRLPPARGGWVEANKIFRANKSGKRGGQAGWRV
jgi:hypothetical protein